MTARGFSRASKKLDPVRRVEDLARLCARLEAPFARAGEVLEEAGVSRATLERARERWSTAVLADHRLAGRYQAAHAAERRRLDSTERADSRDIESAPGFGTGSHTETE